MPEVHCRTVEAIFCSFKHDVVSSVASLAIIRRSIQLARCVANTAFNFMVPFVKVYVQNI